MMTETKASEKMGVSGMVSSDEAVDLGQKDTLTLQDEARALQACKVGREMWVYVIKLCLLQILNFSEITVSLCLTSPWGVPCWFVGICIRKLGYSSADWNECLQLFRVTSSEALGVHFDLSGQNTHLWKECVHSLPLICVSVTNPSNLRFPVSVLPACNLAHM